MKRICLSWLAIWWLAIALMPTAAYAINKENDISNASLEELTQVQISVSSFARKDEDLWKTPAAVFVITKEDIARSSVSSLPELLLIVPGVQVAQIDASTWAVSIRGFNSVFANKVLVLIDGRSVYSEMYSGTQWDQVDIPLEDIERIEVIRGPGAAVWGTDAANGVINIITKKARGTMGLSLTDAVSSLGRSTGVRYGGNLGQKTQYRAFANYLSRTPFDLPTGAHAFDGEDTVRGGGRVDWQASPTNWITTDGDVYGGHHRQQIVSSFGLKVGVDNQENESLAGGHLLSRWEHKSSTADMALQVYYDDQSRHELAAYLRGRTFDIDFQDHRAIGSHNDLVWGEELRLTANHIRGAVLPTVLPEYKNYLVESFAQDEIAVIPHRLTLTLGGKLQEGTLAGFQMLPSARALWSPSTTQSIWAAVSRAAVAPSVQTEDLSMPLFLGTEAGLPIVGQLMGNPAFKAEMVLAYELGYRTRVRRTLTLDVATFLNRNSRIQSLLVGTPAFELTPSPHIQESLLYVNGFRASTSGIEGTVSWKPLPSFSVQGNYAWMQAHTVQTEPGASGIIDTWNTPRNSFSGSTSWCFAPRWSANGFFSYVGALPPSADSASGTDSTVSAYTRLDLNLSRKVGRHLEFDAGGTNLLTPRHFEFGNGTGFVTPAEVPRSVFVKGGWSF